MTGEQKPTRVLVVDDHFVVTFGIRKLLADIADLEVVGEAATGVEAVAQYKKLQPDLILMDLKMPEFDGISATNAILRDNPGARILMVSSYRAEIDIERAKRVGACGYVFKEAGPQELLSAIRSIAAGELHFPPEETVGAKITNPGEEALTTRDLQILKLIAQGLNYKEIAEKLGMSPNSIKVYASKMLSKMGVKSRSQAVFEGIRRGLITDIRRTD
ncbi:MAG: response regulator transcription factor [Deltaproteobacteria bacterium]|nr:response regulator transcription factor [Deltaproteobacteria bacterium]